MKVRIVPIGNSKGIRIPKTILNELKMQDEVTIEVEDEAIVIKPAKRKPRKNWKESFRKMHERKEDRLMIEDSLDLETLEWDW